MNEDDDIDGLAAEYVLGTLDGDERQLVAARRRTDAAVGPRY
jgi:anti-sigma-K factor RskA